MKAESEKVMTIGLHVIRHKTQRKMMPEEKGVAACRERGARRACKCCLAESGKMHQTTPCPLFLGGMGRPRRAYKRRTIPTPLLARVRCTSSMLAANNC